MTQLTDSAQSKQLNQHEHNIDAAAKRVVLRGQDPATGDFANIGAVDNGDGTYGIKTGDPALTVRLDNSVANTVYVGKAAIASATSSSVWQIVKLDTSSGLIKTWADGDASFNNIWDNRASLSYS